MTVNRPERPEGSKSLVVEFAGQSKTGKSSTIALVYDLITSAGINVIVVDGGGSDGVGGRHRPLADSEHHALVSVAAIQRQARASLSDASVAMIDRGVFDSALFSLARADRCLLSPDGVWAFESALLSGHLVVPPDIVILLEAGVGTRRSRGLREEKVTLQQYRPEHATTLAARFALDVRHVVTDVVAPEVVAAHVATAILNVASKDEQERV